MPEGATERIRTLLLRADNVLKNAGDEADRRRRARAALQEALTVAEDPAVDQRLRTLIHRRIDGLDTLDGQDGQGAGGDAG